MAGSSELADRVRKWVGIADDAQSKDDADEVAVEAARYTAGAAARVWALQALSDTDSDDGHRDGRWNDMTRHAELADKSQEEDDEDNALFHRAQANILALKIFEESNQSDESEVPETSASDEDSDTDEDSDEDRAEKKD